MSEWTLHGAKCREQVEKDLCPKYLLSDLQEYQKIFGEEFGLTELLKVKDIEVKARVAEAICNAPEFFMDQLGKARNSYEFPSMCRELENLTQILERHFEQ